MGHPSSKNIRLSILVPTYDRPDLVQQLLVALRRQTLASDQFELVLVDDGSPQSVEVNQADYGFAIRLVRQENAGPGAARNTGLEHCRAPLTLILNDDAIPAPDLCERHLAIHAETNGKLAVLGTFGFTERALQSPFTQLLADSNLLFSFDSLRHNQLHNWTYFWTCNISLPTAALRQVNGFDAERFDKAIVEDVELGYRLEKNGYRVLYREDARCEHDHALTPGSYFRRGVDLGIYLARMYQKHEDATVVWCPPGKQVHPDTFRSAQATCEALYHKAAELVVVLEKLELENFGKVVGDTEKQQLRQLVRRLSLVSFYRGMLQVLEGKDPEKVIVEGPEKGNLTSILVVSYNAIEQTRRCLQALRASAEEGFPTEYIFVDNGSSDGTQEFLEAQTDARLIANDHNAGAPKARNQAIEQAQGEFLVFMDNDVMVTPGWLGRMHYHAQVDAKVGCVGCLSDRAAHKQQIELTVASDAESLGEFANQRARDFYRKHRPSGLQTSFLMMIRRDLVDVIGGFDEAFSPWGYEDDDYSLRSHLAGYRNRIALDVFVRHEPYQGTAKSKKHSSLLERNWTRFAAKWGLGAGDREAQYEELSQYEPGAVDPEDLHLPLVGQTRAGENILAWPNYQELEAVKELMRIVVDESSDQSSRQLVLRVLPAVDGPVEQVVQVIERAFQESLGSEQQLDINILDETDGERAIEQALLLCSSIQDLGSGTERQKWLRKTGLPQESL